MLIVAAILLADEAGGSKVMRFLAGAACALMYWIGTYRLGLFARPYRGPDELPEVTRWLLPAAAFVAALAIAALFSVAARELLEQADQVSAAAKESMLDVLVFFVAFEVFTLLGVAGAERVDSV